MTQHEDGGMDHEDGGVKAEAAPSQKVSFLKMLGPGVLVAAAAVGASHLVQSTRAGAMFGFQLLGLVIAANLMKYPSFEFGQRYTAATGRTLLQGYESLGRAYLIVFFLVSLVGMVLSISALTFFTAALASNLFEMTFHRTLGEHNAIWWSIIVIVVCDGILLGGRYRVLDVIIKVIVGVLGVTAITAAVAAFINQPGAEALTEAASNVSTAAGASGAERVSHASPWTIANLGFLIALMGWMPAPLELSAWSGVWMREREQQTGYRPTVREALIDFNAGYIAAIILAVAFLSLGALVMHPAGLTFSDAGPTFCDQLVGLFSNAIGGWAGPVVAIAAFTAMFSTTLTCLDGYPRTNAAATLVLLGRSDDSEEPRSRWLFWAFNGVVSVGTIIVVAWFITSLTKMIDFVTIVAFIAAPILAFLNLRLIRSDQVPMAARPKPWLMALAWLGLAFLTGFALLYLAMLAGVFG